MKKLLNLPSNLVSESLAGFASAHSSILRVHWNPIYVIRSDAPVPGKVAIVSGGGSGHEPLHAGYVGKGMLDASCPGDVFTAPTPEQICSAAKAVHGGSGVLFIVKNYKTDVSSFDRAAELCAAEGIEVASVITNDDVAVSSSLYSSGRRGVGVTVLAEKIVGAAAERKFPLSELKNLCIKVNDQCRSMGMALTSCTVPASGVPAINLGEQEMEIGIGIHGEAGRTTTKLKPAKEIVEMLAEAIFSDLELKSGEQVIALVNGMGGTPLIELYLVFHEINRYCTDRGTSIVRSLVGNYITSLEMAGCSITLLRTDQILTQLWDDPVRTAALCW